MQNLGIQLVEIPGRNLLVNIEAVEREIPLQASTKHFSSTIAKSILLAIVGEPGCSCLFTRKTMTPQHQA